MKNIGSFWLASALSVLFFTGCVASMDDGSGPVAGAVGPEVSGSPSPSPSPYIAAYAVSAAGLNSLVQSSGQNVTFAAVAHDASNNLYIAGNYVGSFTFGTGANQKTVNAGLSTRRQLFVMKTDSNGVPIWLVSPNGTVNFTLGVTIAVDAAGTVYVGGITSSSSSSTTTEQFGASTLTIGAFGGGSFVAKYNTTGTNLWAVFTGNNTSASLASVALTSDGQLAGTGYLSGSSNFGSFLLTPSTNPGGAENAFVYKLNTSNGAIVWALNTPSSSGSSGGERVSCDGNGNIYVSGWFQKNLFNSSLLIADQAGFLAKWSSTGVNQWAVQSAGSNSWTVADALAVDSTGNAYVGYSGQRIVSANPAQIVVGAGGQIHSYPIGGNQDIVVTKYTSTGTLTWSTPSLGTGGNWTSAHELGLTTTGVYVGGFTSNPAGKSVSFGGTAPVTVANAGYIIQLAAPTGAVNWVSTEDPTLNMADMTVFSSGTVEFVGNLFGSNNGFIAQLAFRDLCGTPQPTLSIHNVGGNVVITWPSQYVGCQYQVQSTTDFFTWTNAPSGFFTTTTAPQTLQYSTAITQPAAFFRVQIP